MLSASDSLSAVEKNDRLRELAGALGEDCDAFRRERLFNLLTTEEIRDLSGRPGFAFELHTHRHRTPREEDLFASTAPRSASIASGDGYDLLAELSRTISVQP